MQFDDLLTLFILVVGGLSLLGRKNRPATRKRPVRHAESGVEAEGFIEDPSGPPEAAGSLGELFRQITLEQQRRAGIAPRHSPTALPSAEDVEDRETLEVDPVIYERKTVVRAPPVVVSLEETGREAVTRRLKEAAARNRALNAADHRAFDARVRAGARPATASHPRQLKRSPIQTAVIWKEILDYPVSLRDGGPFD